MLTAYDKNASKKATNLSINSDLLKRAKELQINLSATLELALIEQLSARQAQQWQEQNQASIAAYNQSVEDQGVFSDSLRTF